MHFISLGGVGYNEKDSHLMRSSSSFSKGVVRKVLLPRAEKVGHVALPLCSRRSGRHCVPKRLYQVVIAEA